MSKTDKKLDLRKFKFPKVDDVNMVFSTFNTIPELLDEATNRGFLNGNTPYNKIFSTLFFEGGVVKFKDNIDESWGNPMWAYYRALATSHEPKHEHKEAVCAMILSELIVPKLQKKS